MKKAPAPSIGILAAASTLFVLALLIDGDLHAQGGTMRGLTRQQVVCDMLVGWNLGNSMDCTTGDETGWGNPPTTQAMMDAVKAMGFNTVRIPVTWESHLGPAPSYTIDKAWLDRVEVIANYVLSTGMYAIVNTHHDAWIVLTTSGQAAGVAEATAVWTQIATRFRDYGDHLILETFNEPHGTTNAYSGGNTSQRAVLNAYNAAALAAIRGTGGNNATRFVMLPTHGASPPTVAISELVIPNNDPNVLISIHTYDPNGFSMNGSPTTWGSASDKSSIDDNLTREVGDVAAKGTVPVIGEWGSVAPDDLASRVAHAQYYAQGARQRGAVPIWWDNGGCTGTGGFGILNRKANPVSWCLPTIAQALVAGAKSAVCPGGVPNGGNGTGGSTGTGGGSGRDGGMGTGGASGGDAGAGSGGVVGSGGRVGTGGSTGSGGNLGSGGDVGSGGGRTDGSGGASAGTGGTRGAGGDTSTGNTTEAGAASGGCDCDLGGLGGLASTQGSMSWLAALGLLAVVTLVARRRRRK